MPVSVAVHEYQMDDPLLPHTDSGLGSPVWRVALRVVPVMLPLAPAMPVAEANESLSGAGGALMLTRWSGSTLTTDGSLRKRVMSAGSRLAAKPSMAAV